MSRLHRSFALFTPRMALLLALFSLPAGLLAQGPDVITAALPSPGSWGTDGSGTFAYSVATTACNIGDEVVAWESGTASHPVIAQNLYRLQLGRFEQIGLSWVKHGAIALDTYYCGICFDSGTVATLGVGCADPYSANANGLQVRLGPRSVVDVRTGSFPFPIDTTSFDSVIDRRLQVDSVDVDPSLNPSAEYFIEAHYVAADDALAGNELNNASYRPASFAADTDYTMSLSGDTTVGLPAIYEWPELDPDVELTEIDIAEDGRLIFAHRVESLGAGSWLYDYAIFNYTSGRGVSGVRVPMPIENLLEATEFHDVRTHSGEPLSTDDWPAIRSVNHVQWATDREDVDPNANAIRWGMLFNFRVVTNAPPELGVVELDLFEPGTPAMVEVAALVPSAAPPINETFVRGDVNSDGSLDIGDPLAALGFLFHGVPAPSCVDSVDVDDSGTVDLADPIALLDHLFSGGPGPAWPFPNCGPDPTPIDPNHCAESACD